MFICALYYKMLLMWLKKLLRNSTNAVAISGNKDQQKYSRLKIICMYEHNHSIICNKLGKTMPTFGFELNITIQAGT